MASQFGRLDSGLRGQYIGFLVDVGGRGDRVRAWHGWREWLFPGRPQKKKNLYDVLMSPDNRIMMPDNATEVLQDANFNVLMNER